MMFNTRSKVDAEENSHSSILIFEYHETCWSSVFMINIFSWTCLLLKINEKNKKIQENVLTALVQELYQKFY